MRTNLLVAAISMAVAGSVFTAPDVEAGKLKSWHKKLDDPTVRFRSKFNGAALLDKETELTWETAPDTSTHLFSNAQRHCHELIVDERRGWRVPTVDELMTLSAPSSNGSVGLMPDTLPFQTGPVVDHERWWTATENQNGNLFIILREGTVGAVVSTFFSTETYRVMCVRGPGTARGGN